MMHGYGTDSSDWFWMAPMTVLLITILGFAVYGAVRLALHHDRTSTSTRPDADPRG